MRPSRLLRAGFRAVPENLNYYRIDLTSEDVLGPPRVEQTKIEAMMRRISERLFLHDSVQRALVEEDMETQFVQAAKPSSQNQQPQASPSPSTPTPTPTTTTTTASASILNAAQPSLNKTPTTAPPSPALQYPQDYQDWRDAVPRPVHIGQTRLGHHIQKLLENLASGEPTLAPSQAMAELARLLWSSQVLRQGTLHMIAGRMLALGHYQVAEDVLQSMLMSRRFTLTKSTWELCTEAAILNRNYQWFESLVKDAPQSKARADVDQVLLLTEGFVRFGMQKQLDAHLNKFVKLFPAKALVYLNLLNLEAALIWGDEQRLQKVINNFEASFERDRLTSVRFLLVLMRSKEKRPLVDEYVLKLSATMQRAFERIHADIPHYHYSYILSKRRGVTRPAD